MRKNFWEKISKGKRKLIFVAVVLLQMLCFSGCKLALPEQETIAVSGGDRLCGIYMTTQYLDIPFEGDGRIYGTLHMSRGENEVTDCAVVFEDIEGYGMYCLNGEDENGTLYSYADCDELFLPKAHSAVTDEGTEDTMEAVVYVTENAAETYYFNPVYQTKDGNVYVTQGSGMSSNSLVDGASFSHSVDNTLTVAENGKVKKESTKFTVEIQGKAETDSSTLLIMNRENEIIERIQLTEDHEMWEKGELKLPAEAEYLILQEEKMGEDTQGEQTRTIIDKEEETATVLYPGENGLFVPRYLTLEWQ